MQNSVMATVELSLLTTLNRRLRTFPETNFRFEFIRECMKINKIRPKFRFFDKNRKKRIILRFCFVFYCLFASRAIWTAVLSMFKILSCTNNKK